jgi:hypothetical protein
LRTRRTPKAKLFDSLRDAISKGTEELKCHHSGKRKTDDQYKPRA